MPGLMPVPQISHPLAERSPAAYPATELLDGCLRGRVAGAVRPGVAGRELGVRLAEPATAWAGRSVTGLGTHRCGPSTRAVLRSWRSTRWWQYGLAGTSRNSSPLTSRGSTCSRGTRKRCTSTLTGRKIASELEHVRPRADEGALEAVRSSTWRIRSGTRRLTGIRAPFYKADRVSGVSAGACGVQRAVAAGAGGGG